MCITEKFQTSVKKFKKYKNKTIEMLVVSKYSSKYIR